MGAGNNQQNVAAVVAETAVVALAIVAVWLQWQAGAGSRIDNNEGSGNSHNHGGEFIPPFSLDHGKVGCCKIEGERWNGRRR